MTSTSTSSSQPSTPADGSRLQAWALVLGMALGSVAMWVVIPGGWVLLAAQRSRVGTPTVGPLLMVAVGAPACMLVAAKVLGVLDRRHQAITSAVDTRRKPAAWGRSVRDADDDSPPSVLAKVMVISVALAFVALAFWFFFLASPGGGQVSGG
ncbi:hypothetical protein DSM112329_03354 [Paraconexibacter sp. AEG42_29]|uniref:Uncharacterized protein n=1 Tax=Paraconexibacter sp. AEG42_29 TaxID=2997339 RepID=A0AAU7AXX0_9ACTN